METQTKRILDYGQYCDLVETDKGNLRIDIDTERIEKFQEEVSGWDENTNELDTFPELVSQFDYLEFIPDLSNDNRFSALTNSMRYLSR